MGHQNGMSKWHVKMARQNGTSKWHVKIARQNDTSKWHVKMAHNISRTSLYMYMGVFLFIILLHNLMDLRSLWRYYLGLFLRFQWIDNLCLWIDSFRLWIESFRLISVCLKQWQLLFVSGVCAHRSPLSVVLHILAACLCTEYHLLLCSCVIFYLIHTFCNCFRDHSS